MEMADVINIMIYDHVLVRRFDVIGEPIYVFNVIDSYHRLGSVIVENYKAFLFSTDKKEVIEHILVEGKVELTSEERDEVLKKCIDILYADMLR